MDRKGTSLETVGNQQFIIIILEEEVSEEEDTFEVEITFREGDLEGQDREAECLVEVIAKEVIAKEMSSLRVEVTTRL